MGDEDNVRDDDVSSDALASHTSPTTGKAIASQSCLAVMRTDRHSSLRRPHRTRLRKGEMDITLVELSADIDTQIGNAFHEASLGLTTTD